MRERRPDGTVVETRRDADGNVEREVAYPDGSSKTFTRDPQGRRTLTKRDAEGEVVLEAERDPSGVEVRTYPDGSTARRHRDEDGNIVETRVGADGSRERIVRDANGKVLSREFTPAEREPGQAAYEDLTGGRDWDALSEEEKQRYAKMEEGLGDRGVLDEARKNRSRKEAVQGDRDRAETDRQLKEAEEALKRIPAADEVAKKDRKLLSDAERREAELALKGLKWVLDLPDVKLKHIQEQLAKAIDDKDGDLIRELMATDRGSLLGFLNRHPGIVRNWEEKVKPTLNAGTSALAAGLAVTKAVDLAFEGKYAEALQSFLDAGAQGLKAIPPGELAKIQRELGRSPSEYALAAKSLVGFAHEAFRTPTAKKPRDWGKLFKEGVGTIYNLYKSLPDEQRKHFIERQLPFIRNGLKRIETNTPGAKAVLGLVDTAPEIWKLYSEWDTGKRWVNISNLAQKLGPKVVGALVKASTKSDAAAEIVEAAVQLGADYMGHLGAEAREAAEGAFKAAAQDAQSYARMRAELNRLAVKAGMTREDVRAYDFLTNVAAGHRGSLVMSDMRRAKNLLGVRESLQAWRRVNKETDAGGVGVKGFYKSLVDRRGSGDEAAYQRWLRGHVAGARKNIAAIDRMLPEYKAGSPARRFLVAWRHDLANMVRTFG